MRPTIVFFFCLLGAATLFAEEELLTQLISADRTVRKNAAERATGLSKEQLIALAQDVVDAGTLTKTDRIYAFHRVLSIAREKGFGVTDALALLDEEKSAEFKHGILDWLNEFGVKGVSPDDAVSLLSKVGRHFTDRNKDITLRLAAHSVCRELAWQAKRMLRESEMRDVSERQRDKASKEVRAHIERVCRIIADDTEADGVVESFAGYVPYYARAYARDGVYEEALLKSAVEQALNEKRSKKCNDALQAVLSVHLKEEK